MEFRSNWYAFISYFWDPLFQIQFPVDQCRVFIAFWYWGAILLYWYRLWVLSFNREPFPEIKETTIILAWLSFIQATTVALVSHSRCQYPASRSYTFTFFFTAFPIQVETRSSLPNVSRTGYSFNKTRRNRFLFIVLLLHGIWPRLRSRGT